MASKASDQDGATDRPSWLDMPQGAFDTEAPPVQLAMFAEPDRLGTPDMFGGDL